MRRKLREGRHARRLFQKIIGRKAWDQGGGQDRPSESAEELRRNTGKIADRSCRSKRSEGPTGVHSLFHDEQERTGKHISAVEKESFTKGDALDLLAQGSSNVETDLNVNSVIEIGLNNGLVDVKVAAIDETWSGLKFVYRLKDRK